MVDQDLVNAWLREVAEQIRLKKAKVERLQQEIAADMRQEAALKALLGHAPANALPETTSPVPNRGGHEAQPMTVELQSSVTTEKQAVTMHPIEQGAVEILAERSKATHVSELRSELCRRGIPIPGKGTDANVIVYLSQSRDICRVGRGLYALKSWGIPEIPPRRRRSRVKRRKVGRRAS